VENQQVNKPESVRLEPVPNVIIETAGSELFETNNSLSGTISTATRKYRLMTGCNYNVSFDDIMNAEKKST
jgi:hypothetical protein